MRWLICAVALGASLLTPMCDAKEPAMSDTKTYCVGRYLVDLPADAQINGQAYQYMFGRIDSAASGESEERFAQEMSQREADLKAGRQKQKFTLSGVKSPTPNIRIFELSRQLLTGPSAGVEAYRWDQGHVFSLQQTGFDPDRYPTILSHLQTELLPNLHARPDNEIPSTPGFCLKDGFISSDGKTSHSEDAGISFKFARWPGILVSVRAMTVSRLGEPTLLQRADGGSVPDAFRNLVSQIRVLRRGPREINGRQGEELLETIPAEGNSQFHQFRWEAQGSAIDAPLQPTLIVEFESGMTSINGNPVRPNLTTDQAVAVFDAVANSVRLRPADGSRISESAPPPTLPLGTLAQTGLACPQAGWWTCPEANAHEIVGGPRQFFKAGAVMPAALVQAPPSFADRLLGKHPHYAVSTTWELVAYEDQPGSRAQPGLHSGDAQ